MNGGNGEMAIYRNVQMAFWSDTKIADDFTAKEKYLYLYLLTNPHSNLCGCYEISISQMALETAIEKKDIPELISRLQDVHKVILFSKDTKEILLLNHHKYNWTSSEKFRKPLEKEINSVKNEGFKAYLLDLFNGIDTVSIPYQYGNDTTVSVSDTVSDTVSVSDTEKEKKKKNKKEYEEPKESYGELGNVKLTIKEYDRLLNDYGYELTHKAIDYLDGYIADKKYKSADNNRALRRWVFDAVKEQEQKRAKLNGQQKQSNFDAVAERFLARGEEDAKEGNFGNFEGAM